MLRRRSQLDKSNSRMNLALASKFIDGVKNDEIKTFLATHYTPLSTIASTAEELRLKSKEHMLQKSPTKSEHCKNNFNNGPISQGNNWNKPRDDMDKRRSFAICSSTDHHVSACPTYKQCMRMVGFSLEDEDAPEIDHEYLQNSIPGVSFATWRFILGQMVHSFRRVPANFDPRFFICNLEVHLRPHGPQFWDNGRHQAPKA